MIAALKKLLTLRCLMAIALIFWCAGAGCMMVSYAHGAMNSDAAATQGEQAITSRAMEAHACCKAKHKALQRTRITRQENNQFSEFSTSLPVPGNSMNCCPLTSGSLVVASRSQNNDSASELATEDSLSIKLQNSPQTQVAVPLRLPNRARSYLLDCAFLI